MFLTITYLNNTYFKECIIYPTCYARVGRGGILLIISSSISHFTQMRRIRISLKVLENYFLQYYRQYQYNQTLKANGILL